MIVLRAPLHSLTAPTVRKFALVFERAKAKDTSRLVNKKYRAIYDYISPDQDDLSVSRCACVQCCRQPFRCR